MPPATSRTSYEVANIQRCNLFVANFAPAGFSSTANNPSGRAWVASHKPDISDSFWRVYLEDIAWLRNLPVHFTQQSIISFIRVKN
jgi:hypothetical protein